MDKTHILVTYTFTNSNHSFQHSPVLLLFLFQFKITQLFHFMLIIFFSHCTENRQSLPAGAKAFLTQVLYIKDRHFSSSKCSYSGPPMLRNKKCLHSVTKTRSVNFTSFFFSTFHLNSTSPSLSCISPETTQGLQEV